MAIDRTTQRTTASNQRQPAATTTPRSPAPAAPSPAKALQQRLGNQGTQALIQSKGAAPESARGTVSSETVDISTGIFNPSEKVQSEIKAQPDGLMVCVVAKGLTDKGHVKIKTDRGNQYDSVGRGSMPLLLGPWAQQLGGMHLNITVINNKITGNASLKPNVGASYDWLQKAVKDSADLLGGKGLEVGKHLPKPINTFENGKLTLGVEKLKVEVGGFIDAEFKLEVENAGKPKIDAIADVNIGGLADGKGKLILSNTQGDLTGQVSLAIIFKAFSGSVLVKYCADGTVDVSGKAAYDADKLSGEIEFIATDEETANKFAKDAIEAAGGLNHVQDAPPPAPVPLPDSKKKKRGLAATGLLNFNLTQWFAGTVNVVVDGKGEVTVIGKIAPPGDILLFKEKPWNETLVDFEAKAYYGIPVVGNLNLFAKISLIAMAVLGPATLGKIEVLGTYSTDPKIQKEIRISGSLNISAYAGLRLRAEGGAGITLLRHDLKFGIGLNADVGVKAYAEARPTMGYRDPGEFYISGTLEMVAQPMLGLGGEFFIELDAPWWSPVDDDRWAWPLFSKEWPLSDPIGINAVVSDYVLGSGKTPDIKLKKPEFDPTKFMTSMVDDKLPGKSGGAGAGQGTFKDDGSVPKPIVQPKKAPPTKPLVKPGKKAAPAGGKSAKPDPKAQSDQVATSDLIKGLDGLKSKEPYSKAELSKALGALKHNVKRVSFNHRLDGDKWIVTAGSGGKKKKGPGDPTILKAKKEGAGSAEAQKGLAALDQVTQAYTAKGATFEELTATLRPIGKRFGFKSLAVEQKDGFWYFHYELPAKGTKKGPKLAGKPAGGPLDGKKDKGKEKSATGEAGHISMANEVGAKLLDMKLATDGIEGVRQAMQKKARELETHYNKGLKGVKLLVDFKDEEGEGDHDIDFKVVIAPNTTVVKFAKEYPGFLPAKAGTYSQLEELRKKDKPPDGKIREAHHAPPVQFAETIGEMLADAGHQLDLSAKSPDERRAADVLMGSGAELIAATSQHGAGLSAILIHPTAHTEKGGAHSSEIREPLQKLIARARKTKDVLSTKSGKVSVQVFGTTIKRQLASIARDETKDEKVSETNVTAALKTHGPEIIKRAYAAEEVRAIGAVQIALQASKRDGTPGERRSAIKDLKKFAKDTWKKLIDAVKF